MGKHSVRTPDGCHVHGSGEECFPGCPAYDIAKAHYEAYTERIPAELGIMRLPWEELTEMAERPMKATVQALLDKGIIAQPGLSSGFLARELTSSLARIDRLAELKNSAYHERNMCVAALSKLFAAHLARHEGDPEWEPDWRTIVCIHLPTGQATWHVHDSEVNLFAHLSLAECEWDGHTAEEKYERLARLRPGVVS